MTAALWVVPRDGTPFVKAMQELITDTIPSNFSHKLEKHNFVPHVTLTSEIDPSATFEASGASSPQEWLDSLDLPEFKAESNEVVLELDHLEPGEKFFRKLTIAINENENLKKLAALCKVEGSGKKASGEEAQKWANSEYEPHLSLFYADLPKKDVQDKLTMIELQLGWAIGSLFDCCGGTLSMGGSLVLVDTRKPIAEWKPIASRETPWAMWKMSRNLI